MPTVIGYHDVKDKDRTGFAFARRLQQFFGFFGATNIGRSG